MAAIGMMQNCAPCTIRLPRSWREPLDIPDGLTTSRSTLGEAFEELVTRFPQLQERLLSESGELRSFVGVFIDGEPPDIELGLGSPLRAGGELTVVAAIAGG